MMKRGVMKKRYLLLLVTALLSACAFGNFASSAQPLEGVIRHYETGAPIPDAFVVARWFVDGGGLGHGGNSICFHVEVTKSDAEGHYYFPVPKVDPDFAYASNFSTFVNAYKPGFRWVHTENGAIRPVDQLIETDETSGERMNTLWDVLKNVDCDAGRESRKNLLSLYQAMYADANRAAVTKDDRGEAIYILSEIESIEIGADAADEKYNERMSRLK